MANRIATPALKKNKAVAVISNRSTLVERIRSVTGALYSAPNPRERQALVEELGALTQIVADLPPLR